MWVAKPRRKNCTNPTRRILVFIFVNEQFQAFQKLILQWHNLNRGFSNSNFLKDKINSKKYHAQSTYNSYPSWLSLVRIKTSLILLGSILCLILIAPLTKHETGWRYKKTYGKKYSL